MNIRNAFILVVGVSLLGASCVPQKAWQGTEDAGVGGGGESVSPTTSPAENLTPAPTETLDEIDENTSSLDKEINAEMDKTDSDLRAIDKDLQGY